MIKHSDFLEAFARAAARRSNHVAVEASEGTFTYGELDRLSNQVANRLRALGVDREARVGISLPRGARELVAMLATAKAGGAYVPLNPTYPEERLRGIIDEVSPQVVVVEPASALASGHGSQTFLFDSMDAAAAGFPATAPTATCDPDQLVYILFTSGSTGRPKGVEITRGAFSNFLGSMIRSPGMAENERLLAITTTSFDIAGLELFLPLCVGATVVIADYETARDPRKLRRRLEAADISVLQATPATWRLLLEAGWVVDRKLRMLCGGEAMSPALADRLLGADGELWNLYGPTETTVWSSLEQIRPGYDRITIGKPIDETEIHVLDEALHSVPIGKEGELWIGGRGVARGYWRRPDLTADRFVASPAVAPGDRIYRTGDLGRLRPDGRFECLGRLDRQVKISGNRIELGEIETVLRSVAGVGEALVVADRPEGSEPRLVAYWTGPAKRKDIVEAAQRSLPAYMVPAAYVPLQIFPLNTNGKIDHKALPKPELVEQPRLPPGRQATEIESRIASVWAQVLGIAHVPLDQSFFTLGGTSALAIEAVAAIEKELGIELPLLAFFEAPTVEGIAANIGKSFSPDAPIVARLRQGHPEREPLFCLFGVTLYQSLALELAEDRLVFGVHIPFRYVPGRDPRPTLPEIGRRYVDLIRQHQSHGPYHLLGLCFGGIVAYEVARQLEAAGETVATVTIIDAVLPPAIHIDKSRRLRSHIERAVRNPGDFGRYLSKKLKERYHGSLVHDLVQSLRAPGGVPPSIDLPVDGPEVEAEVHRFAAQPSKLATQLLVVCATDEPRPAWETVSPDQGWGDRAESVVTCNIPGTHLGVLEAPHVRVLARAITEGFHAQPRSVDRTAEERLFSPAPAASGR